MRRLLLAALLMLFAACTGSSVSPPSIPGATGVTATAGTASTGPGETIEPGTTPGPIAEPTPVASVPPLDRPDLRYRLVDQLGRPLFCDPDFYPIASSDEALLARVHLAAIRRKLGRGGPYIQTVRGVGYRLAEPAEAVASRGR